jgi:hypothetical protein
MLNSNIGNVGIKQLGAEFALCSYFLVYPDNISLKEGASMVI